MAKSCLMYRIVERRGWDASRGLLVGALRMSLLHGLSEAVAPGFGAVRLFTRHGIGVATRKVFHDRIVRPSLLTAEVSERQKREMDSRLVLRGNWFEFSH